MIMDQKPHILMIEDHQDTADMVKSTLEVYGYEVTIVSAGEEGMKVLRGTKVVDLVILDYMLPDQNGVEILSHISQDPKLHHTKVILSSAAMPEERLWWKQLGGDHLRALVKECVGKPYGMDDMLSAIRRVLGQAVPSGGKPSGSAVLDGLSEEIPEPMPISE